MGECEGNRTKKRNKMFVDLIVLQIKQPLMPEQSLPGTITNFVNKPEVYERLSIDVTDGYGVKNLYNLSNVNLLNLTGGVPARNISNFRFTAKAINKEVIKTEINCDEFATSRTLDFKNMIIENDYMKVYKREIGIGFNLFINQVKEARTFGFKELKVHAVGGVGWDTGWNGYHFWAKVGYTLEEDYQVTFSEWLKTHNRLEQTLNEVVTNPNGLKLWRDSGFDWWGTFDLSDDSENMKLLSDYAKRRNLSIRF